MKNTVSIAKAGVESSRSSHLPMYPGEKVVDSGLFMESALDHSMASWEASL